jgi:penicillin-binding protein 2
MLSGQYPSAADIAATQLGQSTAPIGVPRPIDAVPLPGATVDGAATARAEPVSVPAPAPARPASAPLPLTGRAPGRDVLALRRD